MIIIGYSGHGYVACEILSTAGIKPTAYCDRSEKSLNPFRLRYLGTEDTDAALQALRTDKFFIAIGDNRTRHSVYEKLAALDLIPISAIHPSTIIGAQAQVHTTGVMISPGVIINPLAEIGKGTILNTGCIVEHECVTGNFAHIGPGAVLCGNVRVGDNSFVGAGAVVRQGITIGSNAIIGAGSVVVKDVADHAVVMGSPAR